MNHSQSYIICATPRSGTTLLCDLLADTGVAGKPDAFFRFQSRQWWARHLNVPSIDWTDEYAFDQSFLSAALHEGAAGTRIFGMRLMWRDFDYLVTRLGVLYPGLPSDRDRFQAAFGSTRFLHLSREDKVAQAVSCVKAEQSGLWHVDAKGVERERVKPGQLPIYDAKILSEQVLECERHDTSWVNWFARQKIQPLRITYESLSENPKATLARVLSVFDLDTTIVETVKPRTTKLADSVSKEWATRFRTEELTH
ncbi:MAG: Stf0 sulfotransferase [Gammaproteobacteria bacterium]|nr:Stf0 sulfotransferase [Gammaproteobacteria bacterium]